MNSDPMNASTTPPPMAQAGRCGLGMSVKKSVIATIHPHKRGTMIRTNTAFVRLR